MKTIKIAFLALCMAAGTFVSANTNFDIPSAAALEELRSFVVNKLEKANINDTEAETVKISFFLNANQEIVVLKTNSDSRYVDSQIKSYMNYAKVPVGGLDVNETYHINVTFEPVRK